MAALLPTDLGMSRVGRRQGAIRPSEGMRAGFDADDAGCFFTSAKTIAAVQPKAFIFENVPAILTEPHRTQLAEVLDKLRGYTWKASTVDSFDHGVPQRRSRAYIVGILNDCGDRGDPEDMLRDIFEDMERVRCRSGPWPKFLKAPWEAQCPQGWSPSSFGADERPLARACRNRSRDCSRNENCDSTRTGYGGLLSILAR